jgi:outer membrane protein assembly factor BamD (BamD/ComL family)
MTMRTLEEYLRADRLPEARQNLEKLQSLDPNYPGLAEASARLEARTGLEAQYQEALQKVQAGDLPGALALFEAIEAQDSYRDVAIQIKTIKDQFQLIFNCRDRLPGRRSWLSPA